ncbi:MAG TPA: SMP-30/gluconolactonase/LRE family protein [Usitatibacter sp.]|nr:SMP-30/gluconolactonase/LRE family protein [Usitatibacter sp.]
MSKNCIARLVAGLAALLLAPLLCAPAWAASAAPIRFVEAVRFATLPADVRFPEGIAGNPATGDLFVSTFDFAAPNKLVRLDRNGRVSAVKDFGGAPLLGLEYRDGFVYILNFGAGSLQRIPASFDAGTAVQDLVTFPSIGAPDPRNERNPDGSSDTITFGSTNKQAPNAMVFDGDGNAYVSDSFQGAIFEVPAATSCHDTSSCSSITLAHDPLLATAGTPPFGANGLAFSADGKTLFIANTGDHRVLAMDMGTKAIRPFSISIPGADGLLMASGMLWVAANQADQVMALDADGRIVIKAGEFLGVRSDGTPRGLLFPASLVAMHGWMYVTNLALPLTSDLPGAPATSLSRDEPEDFVTRWTVSRFPLPH